MGIFSSESVKLNKKKFILLAVGILAALIIMVGAIYLEAALQYYPFTSTPAPETGVLSKWLPETECLPMPGIRC